MPEARKASDALIVALDGTAEQARAWADACQRSAGWVKVGMTLYYAEGPAIVEEFTRMGYRVFLDLKLYDIPHQVERAAFELARLGVAMLTVHASGGPEMIQAARRGAIAGAQDAGCQQPILLAVTVLTSSSPETLEAIGIEAPMDEHVARLARLAIANGADGIVCSPLEAPAVRALVGNEAAIVTPGVRPSWAAKGDQRRVLTPREAILSGATHLVVGRPITDHADPKQAVQSVVDEIAEALSER